jgi:hypothetical protein
MRYVPRPLASAALVAVPLALLTTGFAASQSAPPPAHTAAPASGSAPASNQQNPQTSQQSGSQPTGPQPSGSQPGGSQAPSPTGTNQSTQQPNYSYQSTDQPNSSNYHSEETHLHHSHYNVNGHSYDSTAEWGAQEDNSSAEQTTQAPGHSPQPR